MNSVNTGLEAPDRECVANQFKRLMADSYTLDLQSHNFHWNVTGLRFRELHLMFEEHYTELAPAIDDIGQTLKASQESLVNTFRGALISAQEALKQDIHTLMAVLGLSPCVLGQITPPWTINLAIVLWA